MACHVCCQGFGNALPCDCGVINPPSEAFLAREKKHRAAVFSLFKKHWDGCDCMSCLPHTY